MLQHEYLFAKIGADTAEHRYRFCEIVRHILPRKDLGKLFAQAGSENADEAGPRGLDSLSRKAGAPPRVQKAASPRHLHSYGGPCGSGHPVGPNLSWH